MGDVECIVKHRHRNNTVIYEKRDLLHLLGTQRGYRIAEKFLHILHDEDIELSTLREKLRSFEQREQMLSRGARIG